jgi:hypothetical protein
MRAIAYKIHRGIAYVLHDDGEIYSRRLGTGQWIRVKRLEDLPEIH